MKRLALVGLAVVLVAAAAIYWVRSSHFAPSAPAAVARYEQSEVALSGGRLKVVSQETVRQRADKVIYRIRWNRAGAPLDQLIVIRYRSHFGGLVSGWTPMRSGSTQAHPRP